MRGDESNTNGIRQSSSEQLAMMLSIGDMNLHSQFLSMDGCNYLIRYLNKRRLFNSPTASRIAAKINPLNLLKKDQLDRIDANCISCLLSLFYWNKSLRTQHAFDMELLDSIIKHLVICYSLLSKKEQMIGKERQMNERSNMTAPVWSNLKAYQDDCFYLMKCQEDLASLLYLLTFNQVSCLREYYELQEKSPIEAQRLLSDTNSFDLSQNIKSVIFEPFSSNPTISTAPSLTSSMTSMNDHRKYVADHKSAIELKLLEIQQLSVYELNFKFNSLLLEIHSEQEDPRKQRQTGLSLITINDLLNRRFKLIWNKYWHGGATFDQLVYDMLFNESLVLTGLNGSQMHKSKE